MIATLDTIAPAPSIDANADVVWVPLEGSQSVFLQCPLFECLYHGPRGNGKTQGLLMSFVQYVGRGYGPAWRGIIFRQNYKDLADIIAKSLDVIPLLWPGARFLESTDKLYWDFPDGERLLFRHFAKRRDYQSYHGHAYPFIGFEELTNWASDDCFKVIQSCCRSTQPGMPRMIRSTSNSYGPGFNWVRDRYRLAGQWRNTIVIEDAVDSDGELERPRCAIHGKLSENKPLLDADPDYRMTIVGSATNAAMKEAWESGSWDITAGGMFDDIWSERNLKPVFDIPRSWRLDRSFDWGSSKPFSVGWWAESDGSDLRLPDGSIMSTIRGDLFRFDEWYGWTGQPNQGLRMRATDISAGIVERELVRGLRGDGWCFVTEGPADSSIFDVEDGSCIAENMRRPVTVAGKIYPGIDWHRADKRPGSRKIGWQQVRDMIQAVNPRVDENGDALPREEPGLFVVGERCPQFLRTVLSIPRSERDLDDVDTKAEDHVCDEVRYRCRFIAGAFRETRTRGHN